MHYFLTNFPLEKEIYLEQNSNLRTYSVLNYMEQMKLHLFSFVIFFLEEKNVDFTRRVLLI